MNTSNDPQNDSLGSAQTFFERYIKAIMAIIGLSGIALWLFGSQYHLKILEEIGKFATLVFSLHFTYEIFIRKGDRQIFIAELNKSLNPHEKSMRSIEGKIDSLSYHTRSILNIISYSDAEFFKTKWNQITDQHDHLFLVGNFPIGFIRDICEKLKGSRKRVSVFCSVDQKSRDDIYEILKISDEIESSRIRVYHIDRFDWGFIVLGSNASESNVEILLNYLTIPEEAQSGYYVFGETALALMKSLKPRLSEVSLNSSLEEGHSAVRISNEEVLDFILTQKTHYQSELGSLSQGIPLRGEETICDRMASILRETQKTLKVTHIAKGENNINFLLTKDYFKKWILENYKAVERGVNIERIFVVPRDDISNKYLNDFMIEMKNKKVDVRLCLLEDLEPRYQEDFSIYDDKDLVYIYSSGGGPWIGGRTEARYTTDDTNIQRYKRIFDVIERKSKKHEIPTTAEST
jgi:hypothetical protein